MPSLEDIAGIAGALVVGPVVGFAWLRHTRGPGRAWRAFLMAPTANPFADSFAWGLLIGLPLGFAAELAISANPSLGPWFGAAGVAIIAGTMLVGALSARRS